jgi:hypothetical protein
VYDELTRRLKNDPHTPFLSLRDDFHPKRNQARQKLATLPSNRFKDLASDVYYELDRRDDSLVQLYAQQYGQDGTITANNTNRVGASPQHQTHLSTTSSAQSSMLNYSASSSRTPTSNQPLVSVDDLDSCLREAGEVISMNSNSVVREAFSRVKGDVQVWS